MTFAKRGGRLVAMVQLATPQHKLKDVLQTIRDVPTWPFAADVPVPTDTVLVQAQELVLAVGPLTQGGPEKVIIAPSMKGGISLTFFLEDGRNLTIGTMNRGTSLFALGKGWTDKLQVDEIPHTEAVERARDLCRDDLRGTPSSASSGANR